jgi:hypothetical protein
MSTPDTTKYDGCYALGDGHVFAHLHDETIPDQERARLRSGKSIYDPIVGNEAFQAWSLASVIGYAHHQNRIWFVRYADADEQTKEKIRNWHEHTDHNGKNVYLIDR